MKMFSEKILSNIILDGNLSQTEKNNYLMELVEDIANYEVKGINTAVIKDLCEIYPLLSTLTKKINLNNNKELMEAYMLGILKSLYVIAKRIDSNSEEENYFESIVSLSKHLKPILDYLYDFDSLTHKQLAEKLNISVSSLSNTLNRIEKYNLIYVSRFGRSNFYSLTNIGRKLKLHLNDSEARKRSPEDYTTLFIDFINEISNAIQADNFDTSQIYQKFINDKYVYFTSTKNVADSVNKLFITLRNTCHKKVYYVSVSVKIAQQNGRLAYYNISERPVNSKNTEEIGLFLNKSFAKSMDALSSIYIKNFYKQDKFVEKNYNMVVDSDYKEKKSIVEKYLNSSLSANDQVVYGIKRG